MHKNALEAILLILHGLTGKGNDVSFLFPKILSDDLVITKLIVIIYNSFLFCVI